MLNYKYNLKELIDTLEGHGETDSFIRDIFRFNLIADENFGIEEILFDPHIARESKKRFLSETIDGHIGPSLYNFLDQLIENDDIVFYHMITDKFLTLLEKEKGCSFVDIVSAAPLSREHLDRIQKILEKIVQSSLYVYNSTSKKILGGFIIKFGEKVVDMSLLNDLEKLKFSLVHHA